MILGSKNWGNNFYYQGDGIYDKLENEEIINTVWDIIKTKGSQTNNVHELLKYCVEGIIKEALLRKSLDNVTAIIIAFSNLEFNKFESLEPRNIISRHGSKPTSSKSDHFGSELYHNSTSNGHYNSLATTSSTNGLAHHYSSGGLTPIGSYESYKNRTPNGGILKEKNDLPLFKNDLLLKAENIKKMTATTSLPRLANFKPLGK